MPRPLFAPALAVALLAAEPCLADGPAPVSQPAASPKPAVQGVELPAKPPVCVPLPAITS